MYEFTTISGRVIEARRYMNRWPRLNEPDPAQERWEVWISERSNSEVKLTVASRVNGCQEALFSGCEGAVLVFGL